MKFRPTIVVLVLAFLPLIAMNAFGQTTLAGETSLESVRDVLENETTRASLSDEQWKEFGERITSALASENEGIRHSALRLTAYHGDKLQMGRQAAVSAVRLYRADPDPYLRKLAVVAIARINHPWGIDFLTRSLEFEDSSGVEKVMRNVLNDGNTSDNQN